MLVDAAVLQVLTQIMPTAWSIWRFGIDVDDVGSVSDGRHGLLDCSMLFFVQILGLSVNCWMLSTADSASDVDFCYHWLFVGLHFPQYQGGPSDFCHNPS
jgi:hypothetical protein